MSDISELAQNVGGVGGTIDQAVAEIINASQEAADTSDLIRALGAETVADQLDAVRDHLDALAASLKDASARAERISTLAAGVGKGGRQGGAGSSASAAASRDPIAIPGQPARAGHRAKAAKKSREELLAKLTEQSEGAGDLASYVEKISKNAVQIHKAPPEPPTITGAGTGTPNSSFSATQSSSAGTDVPAATSMVAAVGLTVFGAKVAIKRMARWLRTPEQFPEEPPPPAPRPRYPWEDASTEDEGENPRPDDDQHRKGH